MTQIAISSVWQEMQLVFYQSENLTEIELSYCNKKIIFVAIRRFNLFSFYPFASEASRKVCCVFQIVNSCYTWRLLLAVIFFALWHLFLSQMEKQLEKNAIKEKLHEKEGLPALRCYYQSLADTQKVVNEWGKYTR